jgi:general secretion pathway protein J
VTPRQADEAGFTLLELLISLGLFALIAAAGLALVDGILKVQGRTEGRLDRLAELQRATFVVTNDLDQIARGKVSGGGDKLNFTRTAPGIGGAAVELQYQLANGNLVRGRGALLQPVMTGITSMRWRFWDGGWRNSWPIDPKQADRWPRAVALELRVVGPGGVPGSLRRVITLPASPQDDQKVDVQPGAQGAGQ